MARSGVWCIGKKQLTGLFTPIIKNKATCGVFKGGIAGWPLRLQCPIEKEVKEAERLETIKDAKTQGKEKDQ